MVNGTDDFAEREKELLRRIEVAEENKKEIIEKSHELLNQLKSGRIAHSEYVDELDVLFQGRTPKEWIDYYDDYIRKCNDLLTPKKERIKSDLIRIVPFVLLGLLIVSILGVLFFGFVAEVPVSLAPLDDYLNERVTYLQTEFFDDISGETFIVDFVQYGAIAGSQSPVRWEITITSSEAAELKAALPDSAFDISIVSVEGLVEEKVVDVGGSVKGVGEIGGDNSNIALSPAASGQNIISTQEKGTKAVIGFFTPAIEKTEEIVDGNKKRVSVVNPSNVRYEKVKIGSEVDSILGNYGKERLKIINEKTGEEVQFVFQEVNGELFAVWFSDIDAVSEENFLIIVIIGAEHLDSDRTFIRDIFKEVSEIDNITYTIPNNEYVRAYFERNLTNENVIDIFVRDSAGTILVYEKDSDVVIGKVEDVTDGVYFIELDHTGYQSIFDMKSIVGDITYDFIHDAPPGHLADDFLTCSPGIIEVGEITTCTGQYDDISQGRGNWKLWLMDDGINITRSPGSSNFIVTNVIFSAPCDSESDGIVTCDNWRPIDDDIPIIWELEAISADVPNEILTNASASSGEIITLDDLGFVDINEVVIETEGCIGVNTVVLDEENATYRLINDVDFDAAFLFICFEITAKNITLDGQGHSVVRTVQFGGPSDGLGIDLNSQNFTLKNINFLNGPGGNIDPGINGAGGPVIPGQPLIIINSTLEGLVDINRGSSTGGDAIIINSTVGSIDAHGNLCAPPEIECTGHTQNKLDIINSSITGEILIYGGPSGPGGNITFVSDFVYMDNLVINATGYDDLIEDHPPGTLTINYTDGFTDIDASYSEKINLRIVNRSNAGEIAWISDTNTGAINSSSLTNLSIHTEIHHNFAFVDGIELPALDRTAIVSLYGSPAGPFNNPVILRDGVECVGCVLISLITDEVVVFEVPGFSSYEIGEVGLDSDPPLIAFVPPTPDDGSIQSNTDIYVNVSSSDENDHYTFVDFDNDLFLWLRMDDTNSSGDPTDLSSYSNNGTLQGDALINSTGYFGNGSHFDGAGDYIGIQGTTFPAIGNDFTWSAWIKPTALSSRDTLWSPNNEANGFQIEIGNVNGGAGARRVGTIIPGVFVSATTNNAVTANVWQHIVYVRNGTGSGTHTIYVNGIVMSLATDVANNYVDGTSNRDIGRRSAGSQDYDGSIDEVLIFNRSLTPAEISALYNASANQYFNNFTGLSSATYTFTGYAVDIVGNKNQTEDRIVTISGGPPVDNPPAIVDISSIVDQTIEIGGVKDVNFFVIVNDSDGWEDIVNVNASFVPPFSGDTRTNSSCVFFVSLDSITALYSCTIGIWYFDEPGQWEVHAAARDTQNLISDDYFENFVLMETLAVVQFPLASNGLTWPGLSPGGANILSDDPIMLNNTGNQNVNLISINASDLIGQSDSSYLIPAGNFSVNTLNQCGGTGLINGTDVLILGAILPRGNNSINNGDESSGQEVLYVCIEQVPDSLPQQQYSASGIDSWDIIFAIIAGWISTIFAVPLVVKNKRKRKLKELAKSLSGEEILEVLGEKILEVLDIKEDRWEEDKEESDEIPISIFKEKVSPAEALCKYLKENKNLKLNEIAELINRDQRTIWTNCNNASKKKKEMIIVEEKGVFIPLSTFKNRRLSVLESVVYYLKEKGFKNFEIAEMLGRDSKNIWTLYSRVKKKLASEKEGK